MKQESDQFRSLLTTFRGRANLTPEQLCEETGILQDYYLKVEDGTRGAPSRDLILRLLGSLSEHSDLDFNECADLLKAAGYVPLSTHEMKPTARGPWSPDEAIKKLNDDLKKFINSHSENKS